MLTFFWSIDLSPNRRPVLSIAMVFLLLCSCLPDSMLQAHELMAGSSPWSNYGGSTGQTPLPPLPYPSNGERYRFAPPRSALTYDPSRIPGSDRPAARPDSGSHDTFQPDLTGSWRGSGVETVVIQRNRARIWGGTHQSCDCVFFRVGDRLIAYSPSTDIVRKYWFQGGRNQFMLIDEDGNVMSFQRMR